MMKKNEKECNMNSTFKQAIWYLLIMLLLVISTLRFVKNGELYEFTTEISDQFFTLQNNQVISQSYEIKQGCSYGKNAFKFWVMNGDDRYVGDLQINIYKSGKVICSETCDLSRVNTNSFVTFKNLDFSHLEIGEYEIQITVRNTESGVKIAKIDNKYNLPSLYLDGEEQDFVLCQQHEYRICGKEFTLRIICFVLFSLLLIGNGIYLISCKESKITCIISHIVLVVMYILINYIYNSSLFFEPTWAEIVTNFYDSASKDGYITNFMKADAGYLPLLQRILAVFLIKILRIPAYPAIFILQMMAFLISGYLLGYFVREPFKKYMGVKSRFLITVILMMLICNLGTSTYINFVNYSIYVILLFLISDVNMWSKSDYILICVISILACMSKGQFVIVLPVMLVLLVMFYKTYDVRHKIFIILCMISSTIQTLYSFFSPNAGGDRWIASDDYISGIKYYLYILVETIRDYANYLFSWMENNVYIMNGMAIIIVFSIFISIIIFFCKVSWMVISKREMLNENIRNVFTCLVFSLASVLFFRLTVGGIDSIYIEDKSFWYFAPREIGHRYDLFIVIPLYLLLIMGLAYIREKVEYKVQKYVWIAIFGMLSIFNNRFQIDGIFDTSVSDCREKNTQIISEYAMFNKIEEKNVMAIPIRPDWLYKKNATVCYVGNNIFGWKDVEQLSFDSVENGKIVIGKYFSEKTRSKITQIFIARNNNIYGGKYYLEVLDNNGKTIKKILQSNSQSKKLVAFELEGQLANCYEIRVCNENNEIVNIENGMYFVLPSETKLPCNMLLGDDKNIENIDYMSHDGYCDIIQYDSVLQPFIATRERINEISVYIGTFNRKNNSTLSVRLLDCKKQEIASCQVRTYDFEDNFYNEVPLNGITLKCGEKYYIELSLKNCDYGNNIVVYFSQCEENDRCAIINGEQMDYMLNISVIGE